MQPDKPDQQDLTYTLSLTTRTVRISLQLLTSRLF